MNIAGGIGSAAQALNVTSTNSANGSEQVRQANNNGQTAIQQSDNASLTSTAGVLAQAVNSGDDVRTDKVAALQAAIASGTYNVPASAVADKLIQSMLG
jgi:negative regulator of flagellin synthesis FlgM